MIILQNFKHVKRENKEKYDNHYRKTINILSIVHNDKALSAHFCPKKIRLNFFAPEKSFAKYQNQISA